MCAHVTAHKKLNSAQRKCDDDNRHSRRYGNQDRDRDEVGKRQGAAGSGQSGCEMGHCRNPRILDVLSLS